MKLNYYYISVVICRNASSSYYTFYSGLKLDIFLNWRWSSGGIPWLQIRSTKLLAFLFQSPLVYIPNKSCTWTVFMFQKKKKHKIFWSMAHMYFYLLSIHNTSVNFTFAVTRNRAWWFKQESKCFSCQL